MTEKSVIMNTTLKYDKKSVKMYTTLKYDQDKCKNKYYIKIWPRQV